MRRHHERELGEILDGKPYAHVGIRQVDFCHLHRAMAGIGINNGV
jgi:hypothetical protein